MTHGEFLHMEKIQLLEVDNNKTMQREPWTGWLPQEMLKLGEELSFIDEVLSHERFFRSGYLMISKRTWPKGTELWNRGKDRE